MNLLVKSYPKNSLVEFLYQAIVFSEGKMKNLINPSGEPVP